MAEWVSFQEIKDRVSTADILGHYGLMDKRKPQNVEDELSALKSGLPSAERKQLPGS